MLKFQVEEFSFHVLPMRTRFPFRYGIASLTWLPHLLVTARVICGNQTWSGLAADGLPPKWFNKNPAQSFEEELAEMLAVIQNAARIGRVAAAIPRDYAGWWRDVHDEQSTWAERANVPGLLAGFGTSLIERAALDALCRAAGRPLHELLLTGALISDLGIARAELAGMAPADFLPAAPLRQVMARHTVGLADWLAEEEIPAADRIDDGLPQSLESCARSYGLSHFKIKLGGELQTDRMRLRGIDRVLAQTSPQGWRCTLDGNEAFTSLAAFRDYFEALRKDDSLRPMLSERLLFVEQPLRRGDSLTNEVGQSLAKWTDAPPLLMDEADGDLTALPRALRLGYAGVSHKNCKGIIKGLANAASIHQANAAGGARRFISGEDLANAAPVALNQDLAMQALLGVTHVERNGHHYLRGLSMWPQPVQKAALTAHPDLLHPHQGGYAALTLSQGRLQLATVNAAPFGCALSPEQVTDGLEPLADWVRRGGLAD